MKRKSSQVWCKELVDSHLLDVAIASGTLLALRWVTNSAAPGLDLQVGSREGRWSSSSATSSLELENIKNNNKSVKNCQNDFLRKLVGWVRVQKFSLGGSINYFLFLVWLNLVRKLVGGGSTNFAKFVFFSFWDDSSSGLLWWDWKVALLHQHVCHILSLLPCNKSSLWGNSEKKELDVW